MFTNASTETLKQLEADLYDTNVPLTDQTRGLIHKIDCELKTREFEALIGNIMVDL